MRLILPLVLFLLALPARAAERPTPMPSLREQAELQQQWLQQRLERQLPQLLRKHGIALWIVIAREYNEDPVFFSLAGPTTFSARRRTIYVFHDRGPKEGVERLALGGSSQGGLYTPYRAPAGEGRELGGDSQWQLLRRLVEERKPRTIVVDISNDLAFSDGLSAGERELLERALGPEYASRLVHAELLPLELIDLRLPEMLPYYRRMMEHVHWILDRALSREVITPGQTTTHDLAWWLREETRRLGFGTWFHPSVAVQRPGRAGHDFLSEEKPTVIEPGDVLWVDYGLTAMGLATDTQHVGYVLRPGESEPPPGLKRALQDAQRLQDLMTARLRPGRTGNEVLQDALAAMKAEGLKGAIYSHPIGAHGHGAGPIIGLWDQQKPIPGRGDVKVLPSTWFSIELSVHTPVPEWGGAEVFIGMEEDAAIDENGRLTWVLGRQARFHLVR
jgi:Xaa-Pro aminopeptidase